jgi:beta-lactamase regulating signal transducer with metallopeptidase domain
MLAWMVYVLVVSLALSAAALAVEKAALARRASTRWVWGLAILASLLLPMAISSISSGSPAAPVAVGPAVSHSNFPLRRPTSDELSPAIWVSDSAGPAAASPDTNVLLERVWFFSSLTMLTILFASAAQLNWRKRRWERGTILGVPVYVNETIGPAIVGLLRPRIVVPFWLMDETAEKKTLVIAHEQSHIEARDAQLLSIAVFLLAAMPWNLPLWWQLHRLRRAVELDCDARVLRRGHDVRRYGETLIAVGEKQSVNITVVAAMSESKSFLEQRIRTMLRKPTKWAWLSATVLAGVGIGFAAVAAQVVPPVAGAHASPTLAPKPDSATPKEVSVDIPTLESYVGYYKVNDYAVVTITRDGQQLSAQFGIYPNFLIYPSSNSEFFYKVIDAQLSFVTDPHGKVEAVILHLHGNNITMPRIGISAAAAHEMASQLGYRIDGHIPLPGSEAALRRQIAGILDNKPDYAEMGPALADAARQQMPKLGPKIAGLGAVQSIKYLGVDPLGNDLYKVTQKNGTRRWTIMVDSKGIVTGLEVERGWW